MDNRTISMKMLAVLRKKLVLILVFTLLGGGLGYLATQIILTEKYEASAQLVYRVNSTASREEVMAKTLLTKTYRRILLSEQNLANAKEKINQESEETIKLAELKDNLEVTQEQEEMVLTVTIQAEDYATAEQQVILFSEASIETLAQINDVEGDIEIIISEGEDKKPVFPDVLVVTAIGFMIGFMGSVIVVLLLNQLKEQGGQNGRDGNEHS